MEQTQRPLEGIKVVEMATLLPSRQSVESWPIWGPR